MFKKNILLLILLILIYGCGKTKEEKIYDNANKIYKQAKKDYKLSEKDFNQQITIMNKSIKEYEKIINLKILAGERTGYIYKKIGQLYMYRHMFDKAIENFEKAKEYFPTDDIIFLWIGICYANKAATDEIFYEDAIRNYKIAIKLNSNLIEAYYGAALIYGFELEDYINAEKYFKKAIAKSYLYSQAYFGLAKLYFKEEDFARALDTYSQLLKNVKLNNKDKSIVYSNIAKIYEVYNQDKNAIESWNKSFNLDPHNKEAYESLKRYDKKVSSRYYD